LKIGVEWYRTLFSLCTMVHNGCGEDACAATVCHAGEWARAMRVVILRKPPVP
jgi:hypothetical protein